jgi:putative two-component system response regulator
MERKFEILIVDDDVGLALNLRDILEDQGYSVAVTHDGQTALTLSHEKIFDLAIIDIRLPDILGDLVINKLSGVSPRTEYILITGHASLESAVEAVRWKNIISYEIKPFDIDRLKSLIDQVAQRKRAEEDVLRQKKIVEERTAKLQEAYWTLKKAHLESVKVLAEAIDAKDPYTRGHSVRVKKMSLGLGLSLGLTEDKLEILEYGALIHDIGKIGINDGILQKAGSLTPEEFQVIQEHPLIGVKIVEGIEFFEDMIPMIRHHHERFDGCGYPDGLIGEVIPLGARIIAVSDAFDAMTSLRPHRPLMPLEDVLLEMERGKGRQFDPKILEIFLREEIYKIRGNRVQSLNYKWSVESVNY